MQENYIQELVERSRAAQKVAWDYTQERVDKLGAAIIYSLSRPELAAKLAKLSF